jgi:hypothetical protein
MHSDKQEYPQKALVDADMLVYRVGFSCEDDPEQDAKNRLVEWFTDVVYLELGCNDYKAYITGSNNFRKEVAVTVPYKGNRKDTPRPKHYDALREHLVKRLGAVITDGEEADDAVGIESGQGFYWLVHQDKDLDQLPGWHYNPVKDERYFVTEFEGLRNFYTQMLTGDKTDNIQGIYGIGPVKAEKALKSCTNEQELLEAVWKMYQKHDLPLERLEENGKLLWLRRTPGQMWSLPFSLQDAHGK